MLRPFRSRARCARCARLWLVVVRELAGTVHGDGLVLATAAGHATIRPWALRGCVSGCGPVLGYGALSVVLVGGFTGYAHTGARAAAARAQHTAVRASLFSIQTTTTSGQSKNSEARGLEKQ